jgi:hypothetical protein
MIGRSGDPLSAGCGHDTPEDDMHLDLVAYAADCIVRGSVDVPEGRLTDALSELDELQFRHATLQSLEDGHVVEMDELTVARDELCVIEVNGPRGAADRRVRTVEEMLRAAVDPYRVTACVHTVPTANVLTSILRRGPILAMTDGLIEFEMAGERFQRPAAVLAIVLGRVSTLERPEFVPGLSPDEVERGIGLTARI